MQRRIVFFLVIIVAVFGASLLGDGITGLVVSGDYVKELCSSDADCKGGEVCCYFYQEPSGVCNLESICQSVIDVTKGGNGQEILILNNENNSAAKNTYYNEIILGSSLVILLASLLYYYLKYHAPGKPVS